MFSPPSDNAVNWLRCEGQGTDPLIEIHVVTGYLILVRGARAQRSDECQRPPTLRKEDKTFQRHTTAPRQLTGGESEREIWY